MTDRQLTDSIGRTVLQTVAQKFLAALCKEWTWLFHCMLRLRCSNFDVT